MANPIDELRNALLNRSKSPSQPLPALPAGQAPQAAQAPQPQGSYTADTGSIPVLGAGNPEQPVSTAPNQPALLSGLRNALAGLSGASAAPKTGMTPPVWGGTPSPMGPGDIPTGTPNESARVPPRWKRFETAQDMQEAVRNNWSPNPMLIRILQGGR